MLATDAVMARSRIHSDTHEMMSRLTAKRTCEGIASRLAWKTEKPSCRRMNDRYVFGGDAGRYVVSP